MTSQTKDSYRVAQGQNNQPKHSGSGLITGLQKQNEVRAKYIEHRMKL